MSNFWLALGLWVVLTAGWSYLLTLMVIWARNKNRFWTGLLILLGGICGWSIASLVLTAIYIPGVFK